MKIIRWLLSHTLLILLIVAVIYGYMFWGNLAGDDTPAGKALAYLSSEFDEVGEFVAAVKAKQEKQSQHESAEIKPSETQKPSFNNDVPVVAESVDTGTQTQLAETQAVEKVVEENNFTAPVEANRRTDYATINDRNEHRNDYRSVEPQQVTSSYSQKQIPAQSNASAIIEAAVEPVDDVVTTNLQSNNTVSETQPASDEKAKDTFVSAQIEKQLDNVDKNGRLVDDSLKQDSQHTGDILGDDIRENWITARKSFYQRKYDLSEQNYQKIIASTEDNFDAYGELGNVYFNQGKKEQAASAYFQAATILVRNGQINRARSLMGLLRNLDKSKAGELQKLIDSVTS